MGPARFHCATLLRRSIVLSALYMRSVFESNMFTLNTTKMSVMKCQWIYWCLFNARRFSVGTFKKSRPLVIVGFGILFCLKIY